ncbi:hypothetical protein [Rhodanobacter sp. A1T4]|jgi:hypothetical protein|uniref:hypothetical protein n=1 Tax=Rhodanobacter sp. A1T4 TaxID=2723087 RepID=UPI00180B5257|nr:hypothetical protein [Rhodanobacter sp. A1T4]MBB6245490.1 hypothetical protein [Rhodanobacter sp. A1T4]
MSETSSGHLKRRTAVTPIYRLAVASRIIAALVGGYLVAYASAALLTVVLPMSRINRVVTASLLSFVVWTVVAIGVFAARNAWRCWWPLLAGGGVMLVLAFVFRNYGMRP